MASGDVTYPNTGSKVREQVTSIRMNMLTPNLQYCTPLFPPDSEAMKD
jgi:hypothetical protein